MFNINANVSNLFKYFIATQIRKRMNDETKQHKNNNSQFTKAFIFQLLAVISFIKNISFSIVLTWLQIERMNKRKKNTQKQKQNVHNEKKALATELKLS